MSVITLTTDFGLKDGNVGVMKGIIWGIEPQAQIADISHFIQPQDVREAALILFRSAPYFPAGSIHIAVVDPGVGTTRRPVAARLGYQFFVTPDNGLLTLLLQKAEAEKEPVEFIHLDRPQYWRHEISHVFHGRDIFAPAAAHLASGVLLSEMGTRINDLVRLPFPIPERTPEGLRGEVIHIDHFGNVSTNVRIEHLGEPAQLRVRLREVTIEGLVQTFGDRPSGELVALYGSTGSLIISVVNGSAARRLRAQVGDPVEVLFP